jgi:hypothetical protein
MAYTSDITELANPPLPLDPTKVRQDINVLKHLEANPIFWFFMPDIYAENHYVEGDSPATVALKIQRFLVEMTFAWLYIMWP